MSDWVRVDVGLPDHPKMLALGTDRDKGLALFVRGLCYCYQHNTDGAIPKCWLDSGRTPKSDRRIAERLTAVALWDDGGSTYVVHDYTDYQPSRSQRDTTSKTKAEAGRLGGLARAKNLLEARAQATDGTYVTDVADGEKTRVRATLPPCLSVPANYDEFRDCTLASALLQAADKHFGWQGGCAKDRDTFVSIFADTCMAGCSGSPAQADDCVSLFLAKRDRLPREFRPAMNLLRTILRDDRRDVDA